MISLNLYELRKSKGITQSYLAEVLGVSFQTIAGFVWINGLYQALLEDVRNRLFGEIKGKMV